MAASVGAEIYDRVDRRAPLILGGLDYKGITETVSAPIQGPTKFGWWIILMFSLSLLGMLLGSIGYLFWEGTGIWGLNNPVGWGWAIVNFVFWVGIGHAGTLISAILFLFRQKWRTSINRAAEAMTIFAVVCALLFPTIHVGRVWLLYYVFPIPNQMDMWPNFRSPLLWDVFAVSIYGSVSILFWYVGLIPDLATMRDRVKNKIGKVLYGVFSLGWRGSNRHWHVYERAYLLLAALATPLVLSVHSVVSFDFATSNLPGWHTTIFPPYFVAGAIFSGFAMVLTLMIVARKAYKLENIITILHMENMAKIILLTGSLVGYAYGMEFFIAWYSGSQYEGYAFVNRLFGPYSWAYWTMVTCNVLVPQIFWWKRCRTSIPILFAATIFVNIGMWFERFVITVSSLHRDFMPSSWDYYSPTIWDIACFVGSFGLFMTLFSLFVRFVPMVSMAEIKAVLPEADPHYHDDDDDHGHAEHDDEDEDEDDEAAEPPLAPVGATSAAAEPEAEEEVEPVEEAEESSEEDEAVESEADASEEDEEAEAVEASEDDADPAETSEEDEGLTNSDVLDALADLDDGELGEGWDDEDDDEDVSEDAADDADEDDDDDEAKES